MMTEIYPSNARLIQHININIIHNSNKGQKPHDHRHKVFNKTQFVFKTKKPLSNPGIKRKFLKLIIGIYEKNHSYLYTNGERRKVPPQKSGIRQRCLLSPLSMVRFQPGQSDKKKKSRHPGWKGRGKITSVCRWYDLMHNKF